VFCVFFSISVVYLFCCVQLLPAVHVRLFAASGRDIYRMSALVLYARLCVAVLEVERLCGYNTCLLVYVTVGKMWLGQIEGSPPSVRRWWSSGIKLDH